MACLLLLVQLNFLIITWASVDKCISAIAWSTFARKRTRRISTFCTLTTCTCSFPVSFDTLQYFTIISKMFPQNKFFFFANPHHNWLNSLRWLVALDKYATFGDKSTSPRFLNQFTPVENRISIGASNWTTTKPSHPKANVRKYQNLIIIVIKSKRFHTFLQLDINFSGKKLKDLKSPFSQYCGTIFAYFNLILQYIPLCIRRYFHIRSWLFLHNFLVFYNHPNIHMNKFHFY